MTLPLERAREARKRLQAEGKLERLTPAEKAARNPKSMRLAINAKCWDCQGGDSDPGVRWRIGNCEIPECGLFPVRPYRSLQDRPVPRNIRQDTQ